MRNLISRLLKNGKNYTVNKLRFVSSTNQPLNAQDMAYRVKEPYLAGSVQESLFPPTPIANSDIFNHVFRDARKWQHKTFTECALSGRSYTYGQTIDGALRWAGAIKKVLPNEPNPTVAFLAPNSPDLVVMIYGCFAAGAIVTPINPMYTPEEIASHLKDSGASILVVDGLIEPLADAAFRHLGKVLPVVVNGISRHGRPNAQEIFLDASSPMIDPVQIDPNSVAFLPYSSGTTGKPKGVKLTHAAITNNLSMYINENFCSLRKAEGDHQDNQLGILPFFHIYGIMGTLMGSTLCGSKIITMPKFDPTLFITTLKKHKMSSLQVVPAITQFIAGCPMITNEDLEKLHSVIIGAAPLPMSSAAALKEKAPNVLLQEGYGMTETLLTHITSQTEEKIGYCGQLLPNCKAKVVDVDTGDLLPANTPGELWIDTPSLMAGYHNNDEATNETVTDGWMNTGDIAVYTDDGYYAIVDRIKELIKVKGLQVSPTELEKTLMEIPDIQDVGVIGVPHSKYGEVPAAFIVRSNQKVSKEAINSFMQERFSKHKQLIGGIRFVEELPKNHMGKLLRRKLKDMIQS